MTHPPYWAAACAHLSATDRVMSALIERFPAQQLRSRGNAFTTLARSIVGQQISVRAAQAVWDRVMVLLDVDDALLCPQTLLTRTENELRQAGLSVRKVDYLRSLADFFVRHPECEQKWARLADEQVIDALCQLRGVGRWTAEMFLIFYLLRADVLPLADLGLLAGVGKLYGLEGKAERGQVEEMAEHWRPYRSVATWYVWRSLDPLPVAY